MMIKRYYDTPDGLRDDDFGLGRYPNFISYDDHLKELEEAKELIQEMVNKSADNHLEGYREQGKQILEQTLRAEQAESKVTALVDYNDQLKKSLVREELRLADCEEAKYKLVECLDYLHQSGIFAGGTELHDKCYQKVRDTLDNIDKPDGEQEEKDNG